MSAANLIEKLGEDYCTQRMNGTLFNYNGVPHEFIEAHGGSVYCAKYEGSPEEVKATTSNVPYSFFESWKALSWPKLGYRQAASGQVLMQVGRRGSVQRGLSKGALTTKIHLVSMNMSEQFGLNLRHFQEGAALYAMTMNPQFTPLSKGLEQIFAGAIPAFAVSEDFAVAPHPEVDFLEVLFRGRRIGTVSEKGDVQITAESILPSWNKTVNV
jgi:hypothetical protein